MATSDDNDADTNDCGVALAEFLHYADRWPPPSVKRRADLCERYRTRAPLQFSIRGLFILTAAFAMLAAAWRADQDHLLLRLWFELLVFVAIACIFCSPILAVILAVRGCIGARRFEDLASTWILGVVLLVPLILLMSILTAVLWQVQRYVW
jgi:hypothetical protein